MITLSQYINDHIDVLNQVDVEVGRIRRDLEQQDGQRMGEQYQHVLKDIVVARNQADHCLFELYRLRSTPSVISGIVTNSEAAWGQLRDAWNTLANLGGEGVTVADLRIEMLADHVD